MDVLQQAREALESCQAWTAQDTDGDPCMRYRFDEAKVAAALAALAALTPQRVQHPDPGRFLVHNDFPDAEALAGIFFRDESGLLHQVHPEAVKAYPNDPGRVALYLAPPDGVPSSAEAAPAVKNAAVALRSVMEWISRLPTPTAGASRKLIVLERIIKTMPATPSGAAPGGAIDALKDIMEWINQMPVPTFGATAKMILLDQVIKSLATPPSTKSGQPQ